MAEELLIRSYQPGDEVAIVELFQKTFGRSMSLAFWAWRFRDNPIGRVLIDLAWSGDVLVGHYAVSPVMVWMGGQERLTALSMTTMTHPDYRGRGLFVTLAKSVYRRMADEDLAMVWGFPNAISHRGFVCNLAWVDIHEVPIFRRVLAEGRSMPEPSAHVCVLSNLDSRLDRLWDEVKGRHRILTKRDSRYLGWRYTAHPEQQYTVLGHVQDDRLLGYAVCKRYQNDVDLVDILSVDDEVGLNLVCGVAQWAVREHAVALNMWLNVMLSLHHKLEKIGFRNSEPITYFGARVLQVGINSPDVRDFKNWYLTMGDSDVY